MTLAPLNSTVDAGLPPDDVDALLLDFLAADDEASRARVLDAIVQATMPLADSIALRYTGRGIETDDLLQVARAALVGAVHRYRPDAGRGFAAFAVPTIRGEIKRHFRDAGWVVRPPRGLQELRAEVISVEAELRHVLGRDATLGELATTTGRSVAEVRDARACGSAFAPASLDAPSPGGQSTGDLLADPLDLAGEVELRSAVRAELARLTQRERLILRLRFVEEHSQREIGEVVGVSQMQVSRLLAGLLARLRDGLGQSSAA